MLNLIMTHSPRMAAMTNNKPYGEDAVKSPATFHRLALRKRSHQSVPAPGTATAEQLREQKA
jgi:hypothetical protein